MQESGIVTGTTYGSRNQAPSLEVWTATGHTTNCSDKGWDRKRKRRPISSLLLVISPW